MPTIGQLTPVTTPATTDVFPSQQVGGATVSQTPAQIVSTQRNVPNGVAGIDASGNISGQTVLATGGTTARTLQAITADTLNIKSFGAALNGVTDDTAAWAAAINAMNTITAGGGLAVIYMPPGVSYVNGAALPYIKTNGAIVGSGPAQSRVQMGPAYSGTLFGWSGNAWQGQSLQVAGPTIKNISIYGQNAQGSNNYNAASPIQNAIMINDCTDFSLIENVQICCVAGRAIGCGLIGVYTAATFREAVIKNVRIFECGNNVLPNIEISSTNTDSSNTIEIYGLRIYSPFGPGFVIRSPDAATATGPRSISAHGIVIEGCQTNSFSGNLLQLGDTTNSAAPFMIAFADLTIQNPYTGYFGIALLAQSAAMASNMYAYRFQCVAISDNYSRAAALTYFSGGRTVSLSALNVNGAAPVIEIPATNYVTGFIEANFFGNEPYLQYNVPINAPYALLVMPNGANLSQYSSPASGATVIIGNGVGTLIIAGAAQLAALTINLPTRPSMGQTLTIICQVAIASLTITPGAGYTSNLPIAGVAIQAGSRIVYNLDGTVWC